MKRKILTNAHIIKEDTSFYGSIVIEDNIIVDILKDKIFNGEIDVNGSWVSPGLIDIHSDYIEKEFNPRPNTGFPASLALRYLDTRAITAGITTLFNGISFRESVDTARSIDEGIRIATILDEYIDKGYFLARHYIHARVDITNREILDDIDTILNFKNVKVAVYNDHTPGTRQFRDIKKYSDYVSDRSGINREKILENINLLQQKKEQSKNILNEISKKLKESHLIIGSHDDTTLEHIDEAIQHGASFSEFPTTFEAASYAKKRGLNTIMGAPNLVLGRSQSGNISCRDAINMNLVDALCSDYHFPSMLSAVMYLVNNGFTASQAINLVTINPARIVKIDKEFGSIDKGKYADIIIFDFINNEPIVKEVFINGKSVFKINDTILKKTPLRI